MKKSILLLVSIAAICLSSCNRIGDEPIVDDTDKLVLGDKLENPYSVANMKRAYNALDIRIKNSINTLSADDVVYTTHHYVKFKPKNEEELGILKTTHY